MSDTVVLGSKKFVNSGFVVGTRKRVVYFRSKGWLSGVSREDIPLQYVTSVRVDTARSMLVKGFLFLIGLVMVAAPGLAKVFGLMLLAWGVLLLWGSPLVIVNTAGNDLKAAKGWPWIRSHAQSLVAGLREQLFNRGRKAMRTRFWDRLTSAFLLSLLCLSCLQSACKQGEAPALMTPADKELLEKVKADAAEKADLEANPFKFIRGGAWKRFDKGIINTYTQATSVEFVSTTQFDVADPEGKITYLKADGTELATVPFKAVGEVRAGASVELQVKAGEVSGAAKEARILVERVHVR